MEALGIIKKNFGKKILEVKVHNEQRVYIEVPAGFLRSAAEFLFSQMKCRLSTVSGIDEKDHMEIIYHFSLDPTGVFFNLKVKADKENPAVDTVTDIIKGAKWIEREMHELLGIDFKGNEDLRPLLLSDAYKGKKFPLRKDV
jgi:NADH-quinone oxidoreductase subunit C